MQIIPLAAEGNLVDFFEILRSYEDTYDENETSYRKMMNNTFQVIEDVVDDT